jgi:hypothetical protein
MAMLSATCLVLLHGSASLAQTSLQNDGWDSGQAAGFQAGFVAGEIAASRLVPSGPCPCPVTRVRFLFGGSETQQTITLRIWDDRSGTAVPGAELFTGDYQVSGADDQLQEIDLSTEGIAVLGAFRVGIEFTHSGLPSVARDTDGIALDLNFVDAQGIGWVQSSLLGVTGDWIIRASVGAEGEGLVGDDLRNDGWSSGQNAAFQAGFAPGEIAAVRLVPVEPCPCPLNRVRFLFGGDETIHTITLRVWDDAAGTPIPGTELYAGDFEIAGFDEALQEIDLRSEGITVNGPFRVGIEFTHSGLPSVARDDDGITPGLKFGSYGPRWMRTRRAWS